MLRAIQQTLQAGRSAGIEVSICGEIAGDPLVAPLLVGMGVTHLSMNAPAIPAVKARLRQIALAEANVLADHALQAASGVEVNRLLHNAAFIRD